MCHICGFICYLCVELKLMINSRSISNQALKSAHPSLRCCPLLALRVFIGAGQPLQHGEVRDTNLAWVRPVITTISHIVVVMSNIVSHHIRPYYNTVLNFLSCDELIRRWYAPYYTPASTKLKGGYTGFTLSVCPSVDRIVSALYLQKYSLDPFHNCTSYQATSEGVSREILANSLNL